MLIIQIALNLLTLVFNFPMSNQDLPTASSVIQRCENAYTNAEKYLDSGKVVTSFNDGKMQPNSTAIFFKTAYSKSGLFNYEFYKLGLSNSLYIINRGNDNITKTWWGINNKIKTNNSLEEALLNAQGVSTLSSTLIPKMLLTRSPAIGLNFFKITNNHVLLKAEDVEGTMCYKIIASYNNGNTTIFIDKINYLIRKVVIDQVIKNISFHTEYFFRPYISTSEDVFQFRPYRTIKL